MLRFRGFSCASESLPACREEPSWALGGGRGIAPVLVFCDFLIQPSGRSAKEARTSGAGSEAAGLWGAEETALDAVKVAPTNCHGRLDVHRAGRGAPMLTNA